MPNFCAAYGCVNSSKKNTGISFHAFPMKNEILLRKWLLKIRRQNFTPTDCSKLCSEHFEEHCFKYQAFTNRRELKCDAVPTKFCFDPVDKSRKRIFRVDEIDSDNSDEMVKSCSAFGCTERFKKGSNIGFFGFPKNRVRRYYWVTAVRRLNWKPSESSVICGKHFQTGRPSKDKNHPDYVPNVFVFSKCKKSIKAFENKKPRTNEVVNSKDILHYVYNDQKSGLRETRAEVIRLSREQNQIGAPSVLRDTANPDWAPSLNLGHDYFENGEMERHHENLKKVTEDCTSMKEKDDESEEEIEELVAPPESVSNRTVPTVKEGGYDRLKYFIYPGSSNFEKTCTVTHEEALTASETLLNYMENQDDVDHADLILIRAYRRKILENMNKDQ